MNTGLNPEKRKARPPKLGLEVTESFLVIKFNMELRAKRHGEANQGLS